MCGYVGHGASTCRRVPITANYVAPPSSSPGNSWLVDSGASHNLTSDLSNLSIHSEYDGTDEVHIADGSGLPITHTGKSELTFPARSFVLNDVLCVPTAKQNLLSVSKFTSANNVSMEFFTSYYVIKDRVTGAPLLKGSCQDGVYRLIPPVVGGLNNTVSAFVGVRASPPRWLARLGHPSVNTSSLIISTFKLPVMNKSSVLDNNCVSCQLRLPFSTSSFTVLHPLHYIYADIWGPAPVTSLDGSKYYLLLVDLFTRYCWVYPLNAKSQVALIFPQFRLLVEKQFGFTIKNLFSDNGGEFASGISWLTTAPHTPQQNGIVERRNRHVLEVSRALLHFASLPPSYWSFAVQTAVYLINLMPTSLLSKRSPFQLLFGTVPNYTKLRVFGCLCFPWLRPYFPGKLNTPSLQCVFVGYSTTQNAYKCLDPKSGRIYLSRHVQFLEDSFPGSSPPVPLPPPELPAPLTLSVLPPQQPRTLPPPTVPPPPLPDSPATVAPPPVPPISSNTLAPPSSKSAPPSAPPVDPLRTHHMQTRSLNNIHKPKRFFTATKHPLPPDVEPSTVAQALADPLWHSVMAEKFTALQRFGTWDLVSPPPGGNIIGCKWLFRIK